MKKQTAVEFLAEKYNYITWMRNRDEISAGTADEWRAKFLKEAKQMEKEQIEQSFVACWEANVPDGIECKLSANEYYNKTYEQ